MMEQTPQKKRRTPGSIPMLAQYQ